ncbi:secretion protein Por [Chryseobacterium shigense]|uniref:Por secretion system C-terminal sorting domain-containing protein n=1 Tax=Chryseobacterium shigense TaxID=297244 RepID=A0A1N7I697_9FLAO|nr:S8 family peptidase [Chryseobacterium shigense]PQA90157.1 secretion protein Por [Chryseobacterium shigense]SIS32571.1 Por secretion system C-terminal sorting domain-containing protein [Chryseobacterium shigense]
MKKNLTLVSALLCMTLVTAQNNETLNEKLERQNIDYNKKFDAYVSKRYGQNKNQEIVKEIQEKRSSLAGFLPGDKPYFLEATDRNQILNSNTDFLQDGNISGLAGSFNGENIKFTIFDGSTVNGMARVYADHFFFGNFPNRISNKESSSLIYGDHATAVAGFLGSRDLPVTVTLNDGTTTELNYKGIAPNSTIDAYAFGTTVLPGNSAASSVFQKLIIAQPNLSNHSYGTNNGWSNRSVAGEAAWVWTGTFTSPNTYSDGQGVYHTSDQNYDQIVYNNPSNIIVKSAGNFFGHGPEHTNSKKYYENTYGFLVEFAATDTIPPNNCSQGYDCIGIGSLAKNIIVVGAADILTSNGGRYNQSTDVVHSSYSSAGPRDDGGIKPDIIAVGTNVYSASSTNDFTGSQGFDSGSGTSYSAPVVTGIIGLWTQINKQLFQGNLLNAASAKTLMIHSALEAGNIGPDPQFGWGFIDAKKGAELLVGKSNNTVFFSDETLNNGTTNAKSFIASGSEPLKVTVSWIDPEFNNLGVLWSDLHNDRNSKLINDIDVRIIDTTTNTIYTPWKLNPVSPMTPATKGDNTVDNVEQVIVDTPTAGREYRIEISHKGILKNNSGTTAPQNYSIMITGYNNVLKTNENSLLSGLAVAPSVTKDQVHVLKAPKKSVFTVYDISGKKLQNGIINSVRESIDLSTFSNGIYIIEIKTGKEVISKKVIKE